MSTPIPDQPPIEYPLVLAERIRALFCATTTQHLLEKYSKQAPDPLRLAALLAKDYDCEERHWIQEWIQLRSKVREKFATDIPLLCDRLALEQATGHEISLWKSRLWPTGAHVLDLCCGMGGDSLFLPSHLHVTGIDLDPLRCAMYAENTQRMGVARHALLADALDPPSKADFFQMDPARRQTLQDNQRRQSDILPSWSNILSRIPRYAGALVKLGPGFPESLIPSQASLTYLGQANDCRECLVAFGELSEPEPMQHAVLPSHGLHYSAPRSHVEQFRLPVAPAGAFLCEPNPVLVRSHLFPLFAQQLGLWQIDAQIAYLSGNECPAASPWLQRFAILDSCSLGQQRVREMLRRHGKKPTVLKKRGVEVDPVQELRSLKISQGDAATLFYTRIGEEKIAFLTEAL